MYATETALLKVHSDVVSYMDKKKAVLPVVLDLSAAFDAIHLIEMLCCSFGIYGIALVTHSVCLYHSNAPSKSVNIKFGVS
jgi:hypothetical protein